MKNLKIQSNAKINIGLNILGRNDDGFHNIITVFQEINFFDLMLVSKYSKGFYFTSNVSWLRNDKNNLCVKAYQLMKEKFDIHGLKVDLTKNIPRGSGLGGGSSNAANIIKAINKIYDLNISTEEMIDISSGLGADIPFFIKGGTQLGEGVGDILTKIKNNLKSKLLIIIPEIFIDTSWAYSQFKKSLDRFNENPNILSLSRMEDPILDEVKFFENDFESIVVPTYPEIGEIKAELFELGSKYASLSGSGSTVFGIFDDDVLLNNAFSHFSPKYKTYITNPL